MTDLYVHVKHQYMTIYQYKKETKQFYPICTRIYRELSKIQNTAKVNANIHSEMKIHKINFLSTQQVNLGI